jgi:hypothetical protein
LKVILRASTGVRIEVWHNGDVFHSRPIWTVGENEEEVCLGVDLFEIVADHAGLDLEDRPQAAEAIMLADNARRRLSAGVAPPPIERGTGFPLAIVPQ